MIKYNCNETDISTLEHKKKKQARLQRKDGNSRRKGRIGQKKG